MRINAPKNKVALICSAKPSCLIMSLLRMNPKQNGPMFIANGQGTKEQGKSCAFCISSLQSCLWSRYLCIKGRVCQPVMRSILLYGCDMWPVRAGSERMLAVFVYDCIRRIPHAWQRDCVPTVPPRLPFILRYPRGQTKTVIYLAQGRPARQVLNCARSRKSNARTSSEPAVGYLAWFCCLGIAQ